MISFRLVTTGNSIRRASRFVLSSSLFILGAAGSNAQISSTPPPTEPEVRAAASRILQKAGKADCKSSHCRILVADFTLLDGQTSPLGMQLADQFSSEIATQQHGIQIIERSRLRAYLEEQRIGPPFLNNEKALRWIGKQLGATAILRGATANDPEYVRVQVHLLSCDKEKAGPNEGFTLPHSDLNAGLNPLDSFSDAPRVKNSSPDSGVLRAGVGGVTAPICLYCPQPSYTNPARDAKLQGSILLDLVVSPEGKMNSARILRGLPYGLNDNAINVLREWKFKPATVGGQPVKVKVQIEVTFQLY